MVQPKYSPHEALERIKLMMKYDSSKTLNENKEIIFEQNESGTLTDSDLLGNTNLLWQYAQTAADFSIVAIHNVIPGLNPSQIINRGGVKGIVDALDGWVDAEDLATVLLTIKGLEGKCYFDEVDNKKIPAVERFLQLYLEDEGEDLEADVESVGLSTLPTGSADLKRKIIASINKQKSQSCDSSTSTSSGTDGGGSGSGSGSSSGGYRDCSGTYSYGCKSDVIAKVQGCLGGLVTDGKFGPKTQSALKTKGFDSFTDADVNKICGSTQDQEDEFTTQVDADTMDDIMNS
jgi:hypothetical protein